LTWINRAAAAVAQHRHDCRPTIERRNPMRILVAIDGSDMAARAMRHAVALARALQQPPELHMVYADPPLLPAAARAMGVDGTARYHAENGRYATRRARAMLGRAGLSCREHLLVGDPAETILKVARATKCDLIVMGSHGRSALRSALLGSVTSKVLAHCTTPLTIVR
jgi:nucleotide-binding universal stress UspA family protein